MFVNFKIIILFFIITNNIFIYRCGPTPFGTYELDDPYEIY